MNGTIPQTSFPSVNNQHYSSPIQPKEYTPAPTIRHYATPEESDAVFPIFTTPTHMYLSQGLSPQQKHSPSPRQYQDYKQTSSQKYTTNPQQSYSSPLQPKTHIDTTNTNDYSDKNTHFDPLSPNLENTTKSPSHNQQEQQREPSVPPRANPNNFETNYMNNNNESNQESYRHSSTSMPSTENTNQQKDMLLAQLVEMGFSIEASRVAITVSGGNSLQNALDILVQDAAAEQQIPSSHPTFPDQQVPSTTDANKSSDEDSDLEREKEQAWKQQQDERKREHLDSLKRSKPTPPIPTTPRPPSKQPMPSPPAHNINTPTPPPRPEESADKERKQGNYHFSMKQFVEAEASYTAAIRFLAHEHSGRVLLYNNRAAARLKLNNYQECLLDCAAAISIACREIRLHPEDVSWKELMVKALHRKACALEGLLLYEDAIKVYEECIRYDASRTFQVNQSIKRCQQNGMRNSHSHTGDNAWKAPANDTTTAFPDIDFNMFIPKKELTPNLEEINKSKAVKEMRERERKKEAEEAERQEKEDTVNSQISAWKRGKERNLRALLSTLEMILWSGVQWNGVKVSDLLEPRKCKIFYMKAIAKVHPDKLSANASVEQRMLASGIFTTLNQAWDVFKKDNNL